MDRRKKKPLRALKAQGKKPMNPRDDSPNHPFVHRVGTIILVKL